MKKLISIFLITILFVISSLFAFGIKPAEAKSYRSSLGSYKSYNIPSTRNYNYGGQLRYQRGYYKPSSGKWIEGHWKTGPDNYKWNNRKNLYGW